MNRLFRILLAILLIFSGKVFSQSFSFTSTTNERQFEAAARFNLSWESCATDNEGNTYLASYFSDSVTIADSVIYKVIDVPSPRIFLAKLGPEGNILWVRVDDRLYLKGISFVKIKLDKNGDIVLICNAYDSFETDSFPSPSPDVSDFMKIIKFNKNGDILSKKLFSTPNPSTVLSFFLLNDFTFDSDNNLVFSALAIGKFRFFNINNDITEIEAIKAPLSGSQVIYGKLDSSYRLAWINKIYDRPAQRQTYIKKIAVDSKGDVILAGVAESDTLYLDDSGLNFIYGSQNSFGTAVLIKVNKNGTLVWTKMLMGSGRSEFSSLCIGKNDSIYVSGGGSSLNAYISSDTGNVYGRQFGLLLNKFSSTGNPVLLQSTDYSPTRQGYGIGNFMELDSAGNIYVAGTFTGVVDFNPGPGLALFTSINSLISPGLQDNFIVKYSKNFRYLWLARTSGTLHDPDTYSDFALDKGTNTIALCGNFTGILRFNGLPLPEYPSRQESLGFQGKPDAFYAKVKNNCLTRTKVRDTICFGGTKSFDGETLSKSGKYIRLQSYNPTTQCEVWEELFLHVRPEIPASAGADASVCSGKSQQLGSDSLSGLSYQWQELGGTFTSTQARPSRSFTNFSDSTQRFRFALRVTDAKGCQKRDTVTLSIAPVLRDTLVQAICPGENFLGYDTAGTYTDTLVSSLGCDSIRTLALSLKPNRTFSQSIRLCQNQSLQVGTRLYTQPGIYLDTLTAANGCDSLITSTLNYDIPNDTIQLSAQFGALAAPGQDSYQWLDCNAGFAPITGETDSSFAPSVSGSYAVRVTKGACADTSNCLLITSSSRIQHRISELEVFPNPNSGKATVRWRAGTPGEKLWLSTVEGKLIKILVLQANQQSSFSGLPKGVYLVKPERGEVRPVRVMVE